MADLHPLSEDQAAQARELWGHLPDGEVADDEDLVFRTDDAGNLLVHVLASDTRYAMREGLAWRVRPLAGGYEISCWELGELCQACRVLPDHEEDRWN